MNSNLANLASLVSVCSPRCPFQLVQIRCLTSTHNAVYIQLICRLVLRMFVYFVYVCGASLVVKLQVRLTSNADEFGSWVRQSCAGLFFKKKTYQQHGVCICATGHILIWQQTEIHDTYKKNGIKWVYIVRCRNVHHGLPLWEYKASRYQYREVSVLPSSLIIHANLVSICPPRAPSTLLFQIKDAAKKSNPNLVSKIKMIIYKKSVHFFDLSL